MLITFIHPKTRQKLTMPTSQVVVTDDIGRPLAISYEASPGTIVHCDLNDGDFGKICASIGLKSERPEILKLKQ